jgi:hypothetical protein
MNITSTKTGRCDLPAQPLTASARALELAEDTAKVSVFIVTALLVGAVPVSAQSPSATPFQILDNSFLVEEAFNQPAGIFQNIFGMRLDEGSEWEFGFTQEWPVVSQAHQLSYSVTLTGAQGTAGVGDLLLNYRYQWWMEGPRRPAFSPRLSLVLPTGNEDDGRGAGVVGWQVNLPFSKQRNDLYVHWNAGFTWLPGVRQSFDTATPIEKNLLSPHLGASAIWRLRPLFNLMFETVAQFEERIEESGVTARSRALTLSPGFRAGWNLTDHQLIVGFAVPVTFADDTRNAAAFLYLSYELPFKR